MAWFRSLLNKLRTWRPKLGRWWTEFRRWFGENFIILAAALLFLWLAIVWAVFNWGDLDNETFQAYAMYGTAVGTGLLALATVFMARKNSHLTELTRLSLEKPVITELIVRTIEPLESSVEDRYEEAQEYYLYDIPMSFLIRQDQMESPPRTPRDWGIVILHKGTRYADLKRLYPEIYTHIEAYDRALRELRSSVEDVLDAIHTALQEPELVQIVHEFPADSRILLRYLPFWELLQRAGKTAPHPGYDRYQLWSEDVQAFWQRNIGSITEAVFSDKNVRRKLDSLLRSLNDLDSAYQKPGELSEAKDELKARYNITDQELHELREYWKATLNAH